MYLQYNNVGETITRIRIRSDSQQLLGLDLDLFRFATITRIRICSDSQQLLGSGSVQICNNYSDPDPFRFATITRIRIRSDSQQLLRSGVVQQIAIKALKKITKFVHKDLFIIKSVNIF